MAYKDLKSQSVFVHCEEEPGTDLVRRVSAKYASLVFAYSEGISKKWNLKIKASPASKLEYTECNSSAGLGETFLYLEFKKN